MLCLIKIEYLSIIYLIFYLSLKFKLNKMSTYFSLYTWKELEPLMVKLPLSSDSISKMRMNNTTGYDLSISPNEYLNQIGIVNIHEKNIITQGINQLLYEQLKIQINYQNNQSIKIQLENDLEFTVEKLSLYLNKFIYKNEKEVFLSNKDNEEVLMPSFNIVKAVLLNPDKYTVLNICDLQTLKANSTNYYSSVINYKQYKNDSDKLIDNNISKNDSSRIRKYHYSNSLPDEKDEKKRSNLSTDNITSNTNYYQYSQILKKSNLREYPSSNGNRSFIDNKEPMDDKEDTIRKNKNFTPYSKEIYKYKQPLSNEELNDKDKNEMEAFIKKGYGAYPLPNNLENTNEDDISNPSPSQTKDDYKKFSSEKRNYRVYQSSTPDNKLEDYKPKQYEKYNDNIDIDSNPKRYSVTGKYSKSNSTANTPGISAYELRSKANNLKNQLNAIVNQDSSVNDYSNYKLFKRENDDQIDNKRINQNNMY